MTNCLSQDVSEVRNVLRACATQFSETVAMEFDGEPRSKARPRVSGRHVYTPQKQRDAERALGLALGAAVRAPIEGPVAVGLRFYRSTRQRVDIDNMVKHVFDAANRIVFADDMQVTVLFAEARLDRKRPRTAIVIGAHAGEHRQDPTQTDTCPRCGKQYQWVPYASHPKPMFCGKACAQPRRDFGEARCLVCGTCFARVAKQQEYCSDPCRVTGMTERNKARRKHPKAHCKVCGKAVSRPSYAQCRSCWRAGASALDKANPRVEVRVERVE